jgi:polyisoprenoid-binding protein YceI
MKSKPRGNLTISGVTKQVQLTFKATVDGTKVTLTGETELKMTTYNVEPPTALLGTVKTGDALTIKYKVTYK